MKRILSLLILFAAVACGSSSEYSRQAKSVNLGYGEVPQDNLTYAVSSVDMSDVDKGVYNTIYDYLEGRVPGVQVIKTGSMSARVVVRGVSTINSSSDPLFIVDGSPVMDISTINPRDVKSVDVLKDASTSVYGVRGANGVIIITLKK
ncbi:MAG: TonB-dependent receptor plug domain-containing protein [Bacteroidales bacterium]|nr:TonB-dependent receptor plug domain-containing protein [Bacteroidales bacterium]